MESMQIPSPKTCLTQLKLAIKDYLAGQLSFYCLTEIIFGYCGFFDGLYFTSLCGTIRAKVIGNQQIMFCFC